MTLSLLLINMLYLFHGDDQAASRQNLSLLLKSLQAKGLELHHLDGARLTPPELELALGTTNLFTPEALVIENLFSRVKSRDQTSCLQLLSAYSGEKHLVLWDKKELTKTQLKVFPRAAVKLSKTPVIIWQFLDSLSPASRARSLDLLHRTAKEADEGFIFIMLARRVSDLIIAKSGDTSKLSPWSRSRLLTQAQAWEESALLSLHRHLTEFDHKLKTGSTKLSYLTALDLILSKALG